MNRLQFLVWLRYPLTIVRRGLSLEWRLGTKERYTCDDEPVPGSGSWIFRCKADADRYWTALEVALGL